MLAFAQYMKLSQTMFTDVKQNLRMHIFWNDRRCLHCESLGADLLGDQA
jgi:hypothetical protein